MTRRRQYRLVRTLKGKLAWFAYQRIHAFYYRFLFGHDSMPANKLKQIIQPIEKARRKGDIPVPPEVWEDAYRNGKTDHMKQLTECPRYSIVGGYISYLKPDGDILDVGCGNGLLLDRYTPSGNSTYLGIDISQCALDSIKQRNNANIHLRMVNAETYEPKDKYDVIVFNESLYYLNDPLKVFRRYIMSAKRDGIVVVSTSSNSPRAKAILRCLKKEYDLLDETVTTNSKAMSSWICTVFTPNEKPLP